MIQVKVKAGKMSRRQKETFEALVRNERALRGLIRHFVLSYN